MIQSQRPTVSIGLPVYNGENFLSAAIDSLLAQEFPDFELIISDNASSDRTRDICLDYTNRDSRIRYSRNEHNLGPHLNFLRTLELANGEFFMWAAHDDMWARDYVGRLLDGFQRAPNVLLVAGRMICVAENGAPTATPSMDAPPNHIVPASTLVEQLLAQQASIWFYGMYRRSEVVKLMELLKGVPLWGGDVLFLMRCCLNYAVVGDNEAIIYKRVRMGNFHFPKTPRAWVEWQATFAVSMLREVLLARQPWPEKLATLTRMKHLRRMLFGKGLKGTAILWLRAAYQLSQGRDHA